VAAVRDLEPVVLGKERVLLVALGFGQRYRVLLVVRIGNALEEEQREDVGLEIGGVYGAAQNIRGFPQMGLDLTERDSYSPNSRTACSCSLFFCTLPLAVMPMASKSCTMRR
jgi:hypothetical protein